MSSATGKSAINDTSIEANSSFEEYITKRTKMSKEISMMILEVGGRYDNNPNQLKQNLDIICISNSIKEAKSKNNSEQTSCYHF
jgi:hypothetical protein